MGQPDGSHQSPPPCSNFHTGAQPLKNCLHVCIFTAPMCFSEHHLLYKNNDLTAQQ